MKPSIFLRTLSILAFLIVSQASQSLDWETTQLVRKLGSSNEADRVEARQLLPREGAKVVPDILPYLGHKDAGVWWTADKVLADICNQVSVPGHEGERVSVATQLMGLLETESSVELKERALRLLPIVVPENLDISPIGALLQDKEIGMKARSALQSIGTGNAVNTLATGLLKADKEMQIAILDSLDKSRHINAIAALRGFSSKSDPEVRAAAARGLARWGALTDLDLFKWVWQERTPETEFEAGNAFLLYIDEIAAVGGNTGLAVEMYETVFDQAKDPVLTGAAMMGMAKYGDSRVVGPLFSVLDQEDSENLTPQFLNALAALRGTGANQGVANRFDKLPDELLLPVIGIVGRKGHPVYLPILTKLADSDDAEIRSAALKALADSKLPGGVETLATKTREGNDEALEALESLAESLASEGKGNEAGQAYAVILDSAQNNESRKKALEALSRFPRLESFDSVVASLGNEEIKPQALTALASITSVLVGANQKDKANQGFEILMANAQSTEDLKTLGAIAQELGRSEEVLKKSGFLTNWRLIGPFPWKAEEGFSNLHLGEPDIDSQKDVKIGDSTFSWKEYVTSDGMGAVNLASVYGDQENVSIYATSTFEVPEETEATLRIGSDDWVKVWLNGESVHEFASYRGVTLDQDQIPVTLKKGINSILLRINQGVLGYGFVVRLTDRAGEPIQVE
ncbi:MAG: HEAT repeat domain-containing protein [Candidatus Omnitrophica bacterium]|nr:HEAT repeat domain-containing protein [Candidatus Omnitrophota bacterium]